MLTITEVVDDTVGFKSVPGVVGADMPVEEALEESEDGNAFN